MARGPRAAVPQLLSLYQMFGSFVNFLDGCNKEMPPCAKRGLMDNQLQDPFWGPDSMGEKTLGLQVRKRETLQLIKKKKPKMLMSCTELKMISTRVAPIRLADSIQSRHAIDTGHVVMYPYKSLIPVKFFESVATRLFKKPSPEKND